MTKYGIAIHGGAGVITRASISASHEQEHIKALNAALDAGYNILQKGGSSLDAVAAAVCSLEDCTLFNAGKGSVFNNKGQHEMDASIMWGKDISAGAVALLKNVRNPVLLARAVMEKSDHVFLAGEGAEEFARSLNMKFEPDTYFYDEHRYRQWQDLQAKAGNHLEEVIIPVRNTEPKVGVKKYGTVGAVALDMNGNLAAATSTGGINNKKHSRVGDSPIIGAGTYANNNTCAISCTGQGEYFIRLAAAHEVSCLIEYKKLSLQQACNEVIGNKLTQIGGEGGLIAIDKEGNIEFAFNTPGMYRGMKTGEGKSWVGIYR